jgi:hypothetical protein
VAGIALLAHSERIELAVGAAVQSLTPRLYRQLGVVMRQDKIITKGIAEVLRLFSQAGC